MKTIYLFLLASILLFSCGCSTNHNDHNHSFDDGHNHEINEGFDTSSIDSTQQYFSIERDSTIQMN